MQSRAATVAQYLKELPADRREAIEAVRQVILTNLNKGYEERMSYGMIGYAVPHSIYPAGYHCDPEQPLPFAGLASQKNYMSVYLCTCYGTDDEAWFRAAWAKTGKKLDMGKTCIRFKKLDDLALDVIGESIRRMPVKRFIDYYENVFRTMRTGPPTKKAAEAPAATTSAGKKSSARAKARKAGDMTARRSVRTRAVAKR